ncbi:MAG: insulinase family protein [Bacteroidales bacterium]|nr:insulinase family protein [Bacteroidales bacterium]
MAVQEKVICGQAPCGLRYALRQSGRSVAWCALTIGAGTRDEAGYPAGIAHFVEHTLFRGTRRKSASVISSYLDRLGGELNAFTTKEEIALHATVLKEDLGKALRLLLELATESIFPDQEIETERGVILDEIISYKDNPAEDVYDRFETLLFAGHPLETPILGTAASVKKITPEMLRRFVAEKFIPSRMVLSIVADEEPAKLERLLLKCLDAVSWPDSTLPAPFARTGSRSDGSGRVLSGLKDNSFDKVIDKHHHEVNAVIGGTAPSLYEMPDRLVAAMFANILGGPASNSLLNAELREKRGWVYGIECNYTQYADTGVVAISFGCDKPNLEACTKAIDKMLERLREKPVSAARLRSYRKQLLGQLAISSEAGEAQCLALGKSMLAWGEVLSSARIKELLEAVTPEDLQSMASRLFAPEKLSSLIYL